MQYIKWINLLGVTRSKMLKFSTPQANINRCLQKSKEVKLEQRNY